MIDINCDLGEGMLNDAELMPFISSANIACGAHAGDEEIMKRTVLLCIEHGVAIGAHPSYPDRENFGRLDILGTKIDLPKLRESLIGQLQLLQEICKEEGTSLYHIKPHGALYNRAARDLELSRMICSLITDFDESLILFGLNGSKTMEAAKEFNIQFAREGFADRTYMNDGSLTPRSYSNALIEKENLAVQQSLMMIEEHKVIAEHGIKIPMPIDTICIHGDGKYASVFSRAIHQSIKEKGIEIKPVQKSR